MAIEPPTSRIGADAQLGRCHAAVAGRVVPGLPRDALVDRAASLEGLAVPEVLSAQSPAARGDSPLERASDAPRVPDRGTDPPFRQAGIGLDDEG